MDRPLFIQNYRGESVNISLVVTEKTVFIESSDANSSSRVYFIKYEHAINKFQEMSNSIAQQGVKERV